MRNSQVAKMIFETILYEGTKNKEKSKSAEVCIIVLD